MALYKIYNGPAPTAAAQLAVATGTSIKTMLQILGQTGILIKIKAWGVSMDAAAAAAGPQFELVETGVVAATVTAHVAAGCVAWNNAALRVNAPATYFNLGTEATGFTSSAEDTVVESRVFDTQFIQPTGERAWEFSLGNEPEVDPIHVLRIRVTAAADVDALCWVLVEV